MPRLLILLFLMALLLAGGGAVAQPAPARPDPAQVKADLDAIFSTSEFRPPAPRQENPISRAALWLKEQWETIWKWLQSLFSFTGAVGKSPGVQWGFIAVFLTLGAFVLSKLIRELLKVKVRKRAAQRTAFDLDDTEATLSTEPDAWLEEAERFAAEGDFRKAYRALFVAALMALDRAAVVSFERGRTNGDYLRVLRTRSPRSLHDTLDPFALDFDRRWYGEQPTDRTDFERAKESLRLFRTILDSPAESASLPTLGKAAVS